MENILPAKCDEKFLFSVVMAVYNAKPFLREAIESILNQDIGFRQHVQLILVDDGSSDASGDIADEYALRFPRNVVMIHKCNGGVSSARNEGLKYVRGKYVNFTDSDDKLSLNTLRLVAEFYREHKGEIDLVLIPMKYFDGGSGFMGMHHVFEKGTRVMDLEKEYEVPQWHVGSSFIAREALGRLRFDKRLKYAEDSKVFFSVLLKKRRMGIVSDAVYNYRKRSTGAQSAMQVATETKDYWIPVLQYFWYPLFQSAWKMYKRIPRFLQYAALYNMQWKECYSLSTLRQSLESEECDTFVQYLYGLLHDVQDEDLLARARGIWAEHKYSFFKRKFGQQPHFQRIGNELEIRARGHVLFSMSKCKMEWRILRLEQDSLYMEGCVWFLGIQDGTDLHVYMQVSGMDLLVECDISMLTEESRDFLGVNLYPAYEFRGRVEGISRFRKLRCKVFTEVYGTMIERTDVRIGEKFPLTKDFKEAYCSMNGWMARLEGNSLILSQADDVAIMRQEERFREELAGKEEKGAKEALFYRKAHEITKYLLRKEVWLCSDLLGMEFYQQEREKHPDKDIYLVVRESFSEDIDKSVEYLSERHKLICLSAGRVLSAGTDDYTDNPFFQDKKYYRDLLWR